MNFRSGFERRFFFLRQANPDPPEKEGVFGAIRRFALEMGSTAGTLAPIIRERLHDVNVLPALGAAPVDDQLAFGGQADFAHLERLPAALAGKHDSLIHGKSGPPLHGRGEEPCPIGSAFGTAEQS